MREKRAIVDALRTHGLSERAACRAIGLGRSTQRYQARPAGERERVRALVVATAQRYRRFGYRRITAVLRRQGERINHKRVWALWREEGLRLPRRRPRRRRPAATKVRPQVAIARNHVWTYDFLFDRTQRGQVLKLLTVVDEYTRECHAIRVGRRLDSHAVVATLAPLFAVQGAPVYLRSDNGSEFIAARVAAWLRTQGTATVHIAPGHPWENGFAESFNGKLRDECVNAEVFWHVQHAQVVVEQWRHYDHEERPHSALEYQTPAEVAAVERQHTGRVVASGREG